MPPWLKTVKLITELTSSSVFSHIIFAWNLPWSISGTLVFNYLIKRKESIQELGQVDLLFVYDWLCSNAYERILVIFDLNEFIYLFFFLNMWMDHPRWLPAAITKNSKNIKMTISWEILIRIGLILCQNDPCMKLFQLFANWKPSWSQSTITRNSAKHESDIISLKLIKISPQWII